MAGRDNVLNQQHRRLFRVVVSKRDYAERHVSKRDRASGFQVTLRGARIVGGSAGVPSTSACLRFCQVLHIQGCCSFVRPRPGYIASISRIGWRRVVRRHGASRY